MPAPVFPKTITQAKRLAKVWNVASGPEGEISVQSAIESLESILKANPNTDMLDLAFKATVAVHRSWVKTHLLSLECKAREGLLYRFLPSEFIGFEEFAKYAEYVRPVFEALFNFNFEVEDLRAKYADSVASYQSLHRVNFLDPWDIEQWLRGPIMEMQVAPEIYAYLTTRGRAFAVASAVQDRYKEDN